MTKKEEIKLIQDFYNSLPQDSYLKDILKGVPEDIERQITDDFAMNYLESLSSKDENINKLEKELENLKFQLEGQKGNIQDLQAKRDELREIIKTNEDNYYIEIGEVRKKLAEARQENSLLEKDTEEADLTIMKLKARIYDLMEVGNID